MFAALHKKSLDSRSQGVRYFALSPKRKGEESPSSGNQGEVVTDPRIIEKFVNGWLELVLPVDQLWLNLTCGPKSPSSAIDIWRQRMTIQHDHESIHSALRSTSKNRPFTIALPEPDLSMSQDEEWCLVRLESEWREIRFHDYADVYRIKGLYEHLFSKTLRCDSPATIRAMLRQQLARSEANPADLRVLDLGAGNGMVGEELANLGVQTLVGVDIVEEAAQAAERDRPGIYSDYLVTDITQLSSEQKSTLQGYRFNALTCVAALGFGDIPPAAFAEAFNLVSLGGWIAFNIKEAFLDDEVGDFARLIRTMIDRGDLVLQSRERYVHRLGTNRKPLHYYALVGTKQSHIKFSCDMN